MKKLPGQIIVNRLVLLFILIFFTSIINAQYKHKFRSSNLLIQGKVHYGFLIPHHLEMHIFNAHFPAYEITLAKVTHGKSRWEYMYNYPVIGVSLWHSQLGNSQYFGSATALFPFINFPLIKTKKNTLAFRIGLGIGYIEKPFDRITNYKNIAIGSNINAAANFLLEYDMRINERLNCLLGIGFIHFSNGAIKTPNYGINIPTINAGLSYRLSKENPYLKRKLLPELYPFEFDGSRSIDLNVSFGVGIKDMMQEYNRRFYAYELSINLFKQLSFKSKLGLGFNFSYDGTDYFIHMKNKGEINSKVQIIRPGLHLAYEMLLSQLSFIFAIGGYYGGIEKGDGNIYEKAGIKYNITEKLFTHITLKAHGGRADYLALGLGYKFNIIYY